MKPYLSAAILATTGLCHSQEPTDGANLHTLNCAACHLLDQSIVGPSLVEIRSLYRGKPDDFVKWAVAPGKKRPGAVDMPSMVHVGEPGLRAIHAHMIAIAEGVKEKKVEKGDPFAQSPTQAARPQVQRIFLPNAGPAAIAIALDDQTSLCWDAGACRLRYAWTGGFLEGFPYWKGNGSSMAKIKGTVRYTEPAPLFDGKARFHGYEMEDSLPVFRYTIGERSITERFTPEAGGFKRHLTLSPAPSSPLTLEFPQEKSVNITSDAGKWDESRLTLSPSESASFTLTFRFQ
jgi:cytochrome c551/c552